MNFKCQLDSVTSNSLCDELQVDFDPIVESEDDGYADNIMIWNVTHDSEVLIESLSLKDQAWIEQRANDLVAENAHDLYYEAQIARAESYYEGDR